MTTEKNSASGMQLYAVVDSADPLVVPVEGIRGGVLYNIPHRDIGAAVGGFTAAPGGIDGDVILSYAEAVERLMERYTVLPAKFPTVFDGEDKVAEALVRNYTRLKDNLDRVRGKLEFGVRAMWDAGKALAPEAAERPGCLPAAASGKYYMQTRVAGYRLERALREKADGCIRAMDSHFMGAAAEKMVEKTNGGRIVLSAAYLVEAERVRAFKEAFDGIKASFPELRFLLSGPWPPYSFIKAP